MIKTFNSKNTFYWIQASVVYFSLGSTQAFAVLGEEGKCQVPQSSHAEIIRTASTVSEVVLKSISAQTPVVHQVVPTGIISNPINQRASSTLLVPPSTTSTLSTFQRSMPSSDNSDKAEMLDVVKENLFHELESYEPEKSAISSIRHPEVIKRCARLVVNSSGIIFPLHDIFQGRLHEKLPDSMNNADKAHYSYAIGGAAAAGVTQAVTIPETNYRTNQPLANLEGGKKYTLASFMKEAIKNPKTATKGLGMTPIHSASMGAYFYLFEQFKKNKLQSSDKTSTSELTLFNNFIASSEARLLVSAGVYPFDTLRTQKQKTHLTYPQIMKQLYGQGGFPRFYQGALGTTARNSMTSVISLELYQKLKTCWQNEDNPKK